MAELVPETSSISGVINGLPRSLVGLQAFQKRFVRSFLSFMAVCAKFPAD